MGCTLSVFFFVWQKEKKLRKEFAIVFRYAMRAILSLCKKLRIRSKAPVHNDFSSHPSHLKWVKNANASKALLSIHARTFLNSKYRPLCVGALFMPNIPWASSFSFYSRYIFFCKLTVLTHHFTIFFKWETPWHKYQWSVNTHGLGGKGKLRGRPHPQDSPPILTPPFVASKTPFTMHQNISFSRRIFSRGKFAWRHFLAMFRQWKLSSRTRYVKPDWIKERSWFIDANVLLTKPPFLQLTGDFQFVIITSPLSTPWVTEKSGALGGGEVISWHRQVKTRCQNHVSTNSILS